MENVFADVGMIEIRKLENAKMSMSVSLPHSANPSAGLMPYAKIYLEAMTVSARRDSVATHSVVVRNAPVVRVYVSHLTNLLIKNAAWPDVLPTKIARPMPSASKYLEVSVTAPALQDTNQVQMEAVRMLMSVVKVCSDHVELELCVKTSPDHSLARAHLEALGMLTTVFVLLSEINAHLTISAGKMKNV